MEEVTVKQINVKLNWITTQTKADLSSDISEFPSISGLHNLYEPYIIAYNDASFANLEDSSFQGLYLIFIIVSNSK